MKNRFFEITNSIGLKPMPFLFSLLCHVGFIIVVFFYSGYDSKENKRNSSQIKANSYIKVMFLNNVQEEKIKIPPIFAKSKVKIYSKIKTKTKHRIEKEIISDKTNVSSEEIRKNDAGTKSTDLGKEESIIFGFFEINKKAVDSIYSLLMNNEKDLFGEFSVEVNIDENGKAYKCNIIEDTMRNNIDNFTEYNERFCKSLYEVKFIDNPYYLTHGEKDSDIIKVLWVKNEGFWMNAGSQYVSFDSKGLPVSLNEAIERVKKTL